MQGPTRATAIITCLLVVCVHSIASGFEIIELPAPRQVKGATDPYALHEWGVFTAARGARWAQQDMLDEWRSMPKFFRGVLPGRRSLLVQEIQVQNRPLIVRKPVIYIHNNKLSAIDLTVRFPGGQPLIWWPPAMEPMEGGASKPSEYLRFRCIAVGQEGSKTSDGARLARIKVPKVDEGHWLNHLRAVKASRITVTNGILPQYNVRGFADQFIYYDGVIPSPKAPAVKRTGDGLILQSVSDHDWLDVLVIERTGQQVRVSKWIDRVAKGQKQISVVWRKPMDPKKRVDTLQKESQSRLKAAGLNEDEADSLLNTWRQGLFEQDGLSLIYRVSQKTYDRWLPLDAKPKPTSIVRVGLVLHVHLEPELEARVKALINQLGSDEYIIREKANLQLLRIGGPAFSWIEQGTKHEDAEIALRCESILKALDAGRAVTLKELQTSAKP